MNDRFDSREADDRIAKMDQYVDDELETFLEDLTALLAQPSISATGEGVEECTSMVEQLCHNYGFDETELVETPGQPAIVAHAFTDRDQGSAVDEATDVPHVLIYGHYDVQPVTPDEWTTPPFDPTRRSGPDGRERIYARGAGDNKGQWFAHLCALRAWREQSTLPLNITLLLEGEEESGSPHLDAVVERLADEGLDPDVAYVADGPVDASGNPHVLMGARGMLYVELNAQGPNRDLHSGNYGGPVPNPAWELVRILASMKDANGRVSIDGFYDEVRPIDELDKETLDNMPFDADAVMRDLGIESFADGPGESYLEALLYYPTLNIAGFASGYGGEGTKTIIPSTAQLKMDMRLVADQNPEEIYDRFRRHVQSHRSGTVDLEVSQLGAMHPQRTPLDHPVRDPIMNAAAGGWDSDPILKPTLGGSLPTAAFTRIFGVPAVTVPYANSDENNHSPDENLAVDCFRNGIRTTIRLLNNLATMDTTETAQ